MTKEAFKMMKREEGTEFINFENQKNTKTPSIPDQNQDMKRTNHFVLLKDFPSGPASIKSVHKCLEGF